MTILPQDTGSGLLWRLAHILLIDPSSCCQCIVFWLYFGSFALTRRWMGVTVLRIYSIIARYLLALTVSTIMQGTAWSDYAQRDLWLRYCRYLRSYRRTSSNSEGGLALAYRRRYILLFRKRCSWRIRSLLCSFYIFEILVLGLLSAMNYFTGFHSEWFEIVVLGSYLLSGAGQLFSSGSSA